MFTEWEKAPGEGNDNHCSIVAWRIPWTEEPGRLQFMGSQRIGDTAEGQTFLLSLSDGEPER